MTAPHPPATGRLADLARAGHLQLPQPSMKVEFQIHHVEDTPGQLVAILNRQTGAFAQTLSAGSNGVGVVVGTRVAELTEALAAGSAAEPAIRQETSSATFRGTARPNPTFQHESAELFEAVVCVEDEPRRVTLRHGLALRDVMEQVARISVQERAPLVSMQCPAQIPPQSSRRVPDAGHRRAVDTSRSSSLALRFSMALRTPRAAVRLRIADRLADYCRARGLGLWLADTRPGYRRGAWFTVARHERSTARLRYDPAGVVRGGIAEGCLPVTLVGPARLGSTHAVLSFLARHPTLGVLACSMTPLDELAFLHLQLAVDGASRPRLTAVNRALARGDGRPRGPAEVLPQVLTDLLRARPDGDLDVHGLLAAAEDYQVLVGPALPVAADTVTVRVPVWFTWEMPPSPRGPGLRVPLRTLAEAVEQIGLTPDPAHAPSIEFLACRQVAPSRLRAKGKLAVPRAMLEAGFPATRTDSSPARLCKELEHAWRARLAADPDGVDVSALSVTSRESWLRHWT